MSVMKRLGKPDTGNPSVRFDEGSEPERELTISVGLTSQPGSGLLYLRGSVPNHAAQGELIAHIEIVGNISQFSRLRLNPRD